MKAIIPAAGLGTRFRPFTAAVPKEMLPVGAKPAIQIIAEEAASAGADGITIVISPEKEIVRRYFESECRSLPPVEWTLQTEQRGLGHAVLQAAPLLAREKEPVMILLGDALVSGGSPAPEMAAASRANSMASVIGLQRVPREKTSRYGIAATPDEEAKVCRLSDLVEKPSPDEAPSTLAVAGRYLLDPAIFKYLENQTPGKGGEIQLTDAIRRMMRDGFPVFGCRYSGVRHDIGNPEGYLAALNAFAAAGDGGAAF